MNGYNGNISLMYNSFGKLELRHNDFDENGQLAVLTTSEFLMEQLSQ